MLFAFERALNRIRKGDAVSALRLSRYMNDDPEHPDLVLDLCGPLEQRSTPTWFILFEGGFGETSAVEALLDGRLPLVEIIDASTRRIVASARPGTERGSVILLTLEDCLERAATLVRAALDGNSVRVRDRASARPSPGSAIVARFAGAAVARKVRQWLYHAMCYAPHWRVGWRFVNGPDVVDLMGLSKSAWNNLPDDGFHFYADPFPVVFKDRTFLFVEDFDHRYGRGAISVVEFGDSGPLGSPRPVLSSEMHISYPFVFEERGEMWMVPETTSARTIDLYRATSFPDGWRHEATLVSEVEASDATLFQNAGRWWMMATVRDGGGSYSDALHLWSASLIDGPWIPHRSNPVLIDAAAARPAGRVIRRNGRLIRPVQDCRRGYGAALALAEITRLDDDSFEQSVIATLQPGQEWPGRRIHTLNRAGRLECIDGSAISFKLEARIAHWTKAHGDE
jgi:hypothetical protein